MTKYKLDASVSDDELDIAVILIEFRILIKDPPAIQAPKPDQKALSILIQPNHTINTINSNS